MLSATTVAQKPAANISPLASLGGRDPVIFRVYAGIGDAKQVISFALPTLV